MTDTDKKIKILVVEDDKLLRDILAMKLAKPNLEIIHALDGEQALKLVAEAKPNVVLLDIILPGINGFEVLEKMKSEAETKDIHVIIISNLGQEEDIKKAQQLGAADFIIKANATADEISEKLMEFIEAHHIA
ncbi:MAG: response regulator [Candidatus Paceibacterota bacterium]